MNVLFEYKTICTQLKLFLQLLHIHKSHLDKQALYNIKYHTTEIYLHQRHNVIAFTQLTHNIYE